MVGIIAKLEIKEDKVDEFVAMFNELKKGVATEEGTLAYSLNTTKAEPNMYYIVERYANQDAVKIHGSTDHFKEFNGKVGACLTGRPEIIMLEELDSI